MRSCLAEVIIPFLIGGVLAVVFSYAWAQSRKRVYRQILAARPDLRGYRSFPVGCASKEYFDRQVKWIIWEGYGVLFVGETRAVFTCLVLGRTFDIVFDRENSKVKWIGKVFRNGATIPWLAIESGGQKHYFTADIGTFLFGSESATRQIYKGLRQAFQPVAPGSLK